jgi:hypothetical protein
VVGASGVAGTGGVDMLASLAMAMATVRGPPTGATIRF